MNHPWEDLQPGGSWRGLWQAAADLLPIPVLAIRGQSDGPAVLVTGGVHGDEYEGPAAIHRLFDLLDPATLSGAVIGLPVVNMPAWNAAARRSPLDDVNLNRVFPGQGDGPSACIAAAVFETFVSQSDAVADLHSGGAALVHLPMIGWYGGQSEAERLARRFDARLHPWRIPDVPGVFSYEAQRIGKLTIAAEWGGGARLDPAGVGALTSGLTRFLAHLAMWPEESGSFRCDDRPAIAGDYQNAEVAGLFHAAVRLGDRVEAGGPLGSLRTTTGELAGTVTAARPGIVAGLAHRPWIQAGGRVAYVG